MLICMSQSYIIGIMTSRLHMEHSISHVMSYPIVPLAHHHHHQHFVDSSKNDESV